MSRNHIENSRADSLSTDNIILKITTSTNLGLGDNMIDNSGVVALIDDDISDAPTRHTSDSSRG